ncbi:MFS transporter [Paracoccus aurantiacus]|uniref:MFS transporter n=1 Tax=Paracoccus aurantiacus TaxID=2599412 RepID=A0A5C6S0V8_9RHOB|nr:MFS transporter [Paracoccus aurantiacus]TXB68037.1 MFS transporter [Paracoccus aurantiacus]
MKLAEVGGPLIGFVAMGVFWGAWGTLIPVVKTNTAASDAELGMALLCVALGAIPAMILGGRMVDRLGVRLLLPIAIPAFGASAVLPAMARDPFALGLCLLILGCCSGFMDIVMNAGVSEADSRTGKSSMQFAHGSFAAIYFLVAIASGQARGSGFGALQVLLAILLLCLLLAVLAGVLTRAGSRSGSEPRSGFRPSLPVMGLGVIAGIAFLTENGLQNWSALFFERLFDATPQLSSGAPATVGLAVAIGRFGGQAMTQRVGDWGIILLGAGGSALGCLAFAFSQHPWLAYAGIFLGAAGVSVIAPAALNIGGQRASSATRGATVATISVIAYTGFFVGPAMLGFLSQGFGLRVAMALLCIGAILIAIIANIIRSKSP